METLQIYNTKNRLVEAFRPLRADEVGLYTCGPTVYHYAHIGNLRTYIFEDILKRVLMWDGFTVSHVMNVTDVGHLTSDADEGEDKMEKGAKRSGKTVWQVAAFYQEQFFKDLAALHVLSPDVIAKATDEIDAQQALIEALFSKGAAYKTAKAVYFDVTAFPDYWKFSGQKLDDKEVGVRDEVAVDKDKRHPADFALWLFTVDEHADHVMRWPSPWGEGFPGWHIECSAISMKYLGEEFDIHTGGVDHIGTHHPNEIAQSEAATGKTFAQYWMHGEHLRIDGGKMAKSGDNFFRLQTLIEHGFSPLDYRFMCLNFHYRSVMNFSWDELQAAADSFRNLRKKIVELPESDGQVNAYWTEQFSQFLNDDLGISQAMSAVWNTLEDSRVDGPSKRATIDNFDRVLGLGLAGLKKLPLTVEEKELLTARVAAREAKDWAESDRLRQRLAETGVEVMDGPNGTDWTKV